jgi:hypothetical protein
LAKDDATPQESMMVVLVAKGPQLPLVSIFFCGSLLFLFFPQFELLVAEDEGEGGT